MEFHEVSNLFPLMEGDEYRALIEDIRVNGLKEPIWTYQGRIIDGRNRWRACQELGIEPETQEWDGKGSLVQFVVSLNLYRRHLTPSQRAAVAVEMLPMLEKEARRRQIALAGARPGMAPNLTAKLPEGRGESREAAAAIVGVSARYVSDAKQLQKHAPDVLEHVRRGILNIPEAKEIASLPTEARTQVIESVSSGTAKSVKQAIIAAKREQQEFAEAHPFPEGKYRVIYADPPWSYSNSGFEQSAASHYPTMTVAEICRLPVAGLCVPESVLFLWATSPLLPEALEVVKAWGFTYKASMVWVKGRSPGIGWFVETEHEFLLIATREGNSHPRIKPKSVIMAQAGRHSAKPDECYSMIEAMYAGPYLELFARQTRPNWECWGNEV